VARVPTVVGIKLREDAWPVRELRVRLRPFAAATDWKGRTGPSRTAATWKARRRRQSDQRLQTVFAEFDRR
jgi:hypothetical protein